MILFNSPQYILFLALVFAGYWMLNFSRQNILLLAASLFFYGSWDIRFLGLLILSVSIDYTAGLKIESNESPRTRKRWLIISLASNLLILGFFKYANFFLESATDLARLLGMNPERLYLDVVLPVGISFYSFQAMSYAVDVYRKKIKAARSYCDFLLFVIFFPQLVAGPIERAGRLLSQMQTPRVFKKRRFINGIDLIVWGLIKKVFIADNISVFVNRIFALKEPSTLLIAVATLGFGAQIFFDFSAYSDIARGSGRLLGFELMKNFNSPYRSRSLREFWRRWHISLSSWVRDYIYIPLGGSHGSAGRRFLTILLTWFLCGLWHGAAWHFVLWGLFHGLILAFEKPAPASVKGNIAGLMKTFLLVHAGWLLFRTPSLSHLPLYFSTSAIHSSLKDVETASAVAGSILFYLTPVWIFLFWNRLRPTLRLTPGDVWSLRILVYSISLLAIWVFSGSHANEFIYFQF